MQSNLWDRFEKNTARHPEKPVFIVARGEGWQTVTYQQLFDLSQRFVRGLFAWGLTPGARVALMTPPSVEFFALTLAMLNLRLVPILLDPAIGLKTITACMRESAPEIFIGNGLTHTLRSIYDWGKISIKHNLSLSKILRKSESPPSGAQSDLEIDQLAVIYTSGSTGLPKGAVYTEQNFEAQLNMLVQSFDIQPDEIDLPAFPLYALIDSLLGVTSIIPDIRFPAPGRTNPEKVVRAIQKFQVTNMFASPVVLDVLANYHEGKNIKLPSLRRVITAGAPAPIHLQERFRTLLAEETNLYGVYGATEALPMAVVESRELLKDAREKTAMGAGVCLGEPVIGSTVRVIQITDNPIACWNDALETPINYVGEITVKGAAVTKEYLARPGANQLAKIQDGDEVFHRTGDLGYFDERGRLWYCGRKSHRVTTTEGEVMFTEAIEGIFNAHPLVYRTALVGVRGKPVLWIELEEQVAQNKKSSIKRELIDLGKKHPQASQIGTFLFMKKFPTDVRHNSKIIRERLTVLAERSLA